MICWGIVTKFFVIVFKPVFFILPLINLANKRKINLNKRNTFSIGKRRGKIYKDIGCKIMRKILWLCSLCFVLAHLVASEADLQDAYSAWRNGEIEEAVFLYAKACNAQNAAACYGLGRLYAQGSGVGQDYFVSELYYKMACELGHYPACNSLGVLYHLGLVKAQDSTEILHLYTYACQGGYGRACNNVGVMFEEGIGLKRDYKQAALYYSDACLAQDDKACFNLAELFHKGKGVKRNKLKAKEFYGLACDFGFQNGCELYKNLEERK